MTSVLPKEFVTNDNVRIAYLKNDPVLHEVASKYASSLVIFLPGWSQGALQYKIPLIHLGNQNISAVAIDPRSHGKSQNVEHGHTVHRFAKDLYDFIKHFKAEYHNGSSFDLYFVGHSMGCAVIWAYYELFGNPKNRLKGAIFLDQPPSLGVKGGFSQEERNKYGSVFHPKTVTEICTDLRNYSKMSDEEKKHKLDPRMDLLDGWLSDSPSQRSKDQIVECIENYPPQYAALLMESGINLDWRHLMKLLSIEKVLIVGGDCTSLRKECYMWMLENIGSLSAHEKDMQVELCIFSQEELGSHFMFLENPDKFNNLLSTFFSS